MIIPITVKEAKVTIGNRMVLEISGVSGAEKISCVVQFASGESGKIHCAVPFLDSPLYSLSHHDQPVGELKISHAGRLNAHLATQEEDYHIESKGPWVVLVRGVDEAARLTLAWRDAQIALGILAEVSLHVECEDWVLAGFVFAWIASEHRAKGIAAAGAFSFFGIISTS